MKVKTISLNSFLRKFRIKRADPWTTTYFSKDDIEELQKDAGVVNMTDKIKESLGLLPSLLKDPISSVKRLKSMVTTQWSKVKTYYKSKSSITETLPFSDYSLKASIVASIKPKRLLEIGTGKGWGVAIFKAVMPGCDCITMSPKLESSTGEIVRRKKSLKISQIWADSIRYDFSRFKPVDVTYIDGNHTYKYVYSDLKNSLKITRRLIILDDYIPSEEAPRDPVIQWSSYFLEVVKAVKDFLKDYPKLVTSAYWIAGTRICVLCLRQKRRSGKI